MAARLDLALSYAPSWLKGDQIPPKGLTPLVSHIRNLLCGGIRTRCIYVDWSSRGRTWDETFLANVKEHATLSARAHVDHGVEVGITDEHVNRAADRGCCVSTCWASSIRLGPSDLPNLRIALKNSLNGRK